MPAALLAILYYAFTHIEFSLEFAFMFTHKYFFFVNFLLFVEHIPIYRLDTIKSVTLLLTHAIPDQSDLMCVNTDKEYLVVYGV